MLTKDFNEINIFKKFANLYPDSLNLKSVKKNNPPEPDICCNTINGDVKAFELVEIIDPSLASTMNPITKINNSFYDAFNKMQKIKKISFQSKFYNASIMIAFHKKHSLLKKMSIVPKILENLLVLNKADSGKYKSDIFPEIEDYIKWIYISRGFVGPTFDTTPSTSFSDPILDIIKVKFDKCYKSKYGIELLAYYYFQPFNAFNSHIKEVENFIKINYQNSPFIRVWIYTFIENKIVFFYPPLGN